MANSLFILESVAFTLDYLKYAEAERKFQEFKSRGGGRGGAQPVGKSVEAVRETESFSSLIIEQIAKAREHITSSLQKSKSSGTTSGGVSSEDSEAMREENVLLKKQVEDLQNQVRQLTDRVSKLEVHVKSPAPVKAGGDNKQVEKKEAPADDDDVDLFASDNEEEDAEALKIKEQRLAEYAAKKSKKPALVAKSNVILDVKPWDDETDMAELEKVVRSIVMEGLLWGVSKLVPVGYGIKKLQINTVIVDDLVSVDELTEKLESFDDFVQSVDIAAFNKI